MNVLDRIPAEKYEAFVKESAAIDHVQVEEKKLKKGKGYYGAFIQSQNQAREHAPLTEKNFKEWCELTGKEVKGNHLEKAWLEKFNAGVKALEDRPNIVAFVDFVGEMAHQFQNLNNKEKHTGLLSRLLVNYTATRVGYPFLIFHPEEEKIFEESVKNADKMRVFIADKVQESIFGMNGQWMDRIGTGSTSRYIGPSQEKTSVQWNDLLVAQARWRKGP